MKLFVIKHKSGLFLKNEFPCFNSHDAAKNYIDEGDELLYSYDQDLKKEDLTIIQLNTI